MALDAALAVHEILTQAGYKTYFALPDDMPEGPVVWIQKSGGQRNELFALDRLFIQVLDARRENASRISNEVMEMLIDGHHFVPGQGLIDSIQAESTPLERPYNDRLINFIFTIAVESRVS